jgi:hypothetical protein
MAIIKVRGEKSSVWDFPLLDQGWYRFKIDDDISVITREAADESDPTVRKSKKILRIPLIPDGYENPMISVFCPLDVLFGCQKLVDIVYWSGLGEIIKKEKGHDLKEKGLDDSFIRSDKFIAFVQSRLPGRYIEGEVVHRTLSDGRVVANIREIRPVQEEVQEKAREKVEKVEEEVESW